MANTIKLSEPMVRAMLQDTKETPEGTALGYGMGVGTLLALRDRGLTRMVTIRNGDLADYTGDYPEVQNRYEILTDRGRFIRQYLSGGTARSWNVETLDAQVQAWMTPVCGDVNPTNDRVSCKRPQGHQGNHRPTVGYIGSSAEWPIPSVVPVQPEPAERTVSETIEITRTMSEALIGSISVNGRREIRSVTHGTVRAMETRGLVTYEGNGRSGTAALTDRGENLRERLLDGNRGVVWNVADLDSMNLPEPAEPTFTVKLWYVTGAFEAPTGAESLCRTVFEEALSNERVIAGELHDAHGTTLEAFGRTA